MKQNISSKNKGNSNCLSSYRISSFRTIFRQVAPLFPLRSLFLPLPSAPSRPTQPAGSPPPTAHAQPSWWAFPSPTAHAQTGPYCAVSDGTSLFPLLLNLHFGNIFRKKFAFISSWKCQLQFPQMSSSTTTTPALHSALASEGGRPIFGRQRVSHSPPHPVTHLAAARNQVVLVLANKSIQRIDQVRVLWVNI